MSDDPRPPQEAEPQPSEGYESPAAEDLPDQPVETSATVTMF
jgi:hypothetical protein